MKLMTLIDLTNLTRLVSLTAREVAAIRNEILRRRVRSMQMMRASQQTA